MLAKIVGWLWIITGVFFMLKPHILRRRLEKKSAKKIKKYLFAIVMAFSAMLLGVAWKSEGILAKVLFVIGIIGVFKAFFFLKAKASEKLIDWISKQPAEIFRVWAAGQIGIGVVMLFLR